ncbi:MAG TPA: HAD hydrolase-like protein [Acidimicrobiales bacterium]|nr:HAD hydrolase-like protein [Acidimicrobiales bacterium]
MLWDIDRTLVDVSRVSREIYAVAFERVVGRPLERLADMTGRTEHAILVDTLALNGVAETKFDAFYEALGWAAHDLQSRMREVGRSLPGAHDAIAALRRDELVQSVATGNIRSIAETKLCAFDLACDIDFDVGGYGSDGSVRSELVRLASERTNAKYDVTVSPERVVVIGDTTLDVEGAHGAGARAIGVATGQTTAGELASAGADEVLDDLRSTEDVVKAVYGQLPGLG